VLLLAGEPGIGKTRLLQAIAQQAIAQGWSVLAGGCHRQGGQEPYAPLLEALDRHVRRQSSAQLSAALRGCAWLVRLLPELAAEPIEPLPAWTVTPEQERRLLFGAVLRYLANVAGPSGTLLLLDDLQWSGADALDLLAALARSTGEVPLRVVGAYRDLEVGPRAPLAALLTDLAHAGLARHRAVGPLSPEEAGQLLDGLLDGGDQGAGGLREQVVKRTGGVPFFVVSCAQGLRLARSGGGEQGAVPWDVAQSVRQRAAALPQAAQEVLGVAAAVGRSVQPQLLVAVTDRPEDAVAAALDAACGARLLVEEADGYRFAHDVIREVVEGDLGVARRQLLHRRIGEALDADASGAPVELVAYHYAQSTAQDKAALSLEKAGDAAVAGGAPGSAEGHYRHAVSILERGIQRQDCCRVLEKLGKLLRTMSRFDAALDVLDRAAQMYRAMGETEGLWRVAAQEGVVHTFRGTPGEGIALLQPLLGTAAGRAPSPALAALQVAMADLLFTVGRYAEALAAAERASEVARAMRDESGEAESQMLRGLLLYHLGRTDEGLRVTESALPLLEAVGNPSYLSTALANAALGYQGRGAFERSCQYARRAMDVARRLGDPLLIAYLTGAYGSILFTGGHWAEARRHLDQAIALSRGDETSWYAPYYPLYLGQLLLAMGEYESATRHLEASAQLADRKGDLQVRRQAHAQLAYRDLRCGNPLAARERLVPLLDPPGMEDVDVSAFLPLLAWSYLGLGQDVQAAEVLEQSARRARSAHLTLCLLDTMWVQGLAALRCRRWEEARGILEDGFSLAREVTNPYAEARLLHLCGDLRSRKGEPGPARERLEMALAIFRRLGARKDAEEVERALSVASDSPQS
jgi:tetratricopeptide (TPR) repeat protein